MNINFTATETFYGSKITVVEDNRNNINAIGMNVIGIIVRMLADVQYAYVCLLVYLSLYITSVRILFCSF